MAMGKEPAEQVWDPATFVDFEQGLNFAIRQIRAALGDDADQPRFLQTLPKRGYRFIAAVEGENPQNLPRRAYRFVTPVTSDGENAVDTGVIVGSARTAGRS